MLLAVLLVGAVYRSVADAPPLFRGWVHPGLCNRTGHWCSHNTHDALDMLDTKGWSLGAAFERFFPCAVADGKAEFLAYAQECYDVFTRVEIKDPSQDSNVKVRRRWLRCYHMVAQQTDTCGTVVYQLAEEELGVTLVRQGHTPRPALFGNEWFAFTNEELTTTEWLLDFIADPYNTNLRTIRGWQKRGWQHGGSNRGERRRQEELRYA